LSHATKEVEMDRLKRCQLAVYRLHHGKSCVLFQIISRKRSQNYIWKITGKKIPGGCNKATEANRGKRTDLYFVLNYIGQSLLTNEWSKFDITVN